MSKLHVAIVGYGTAGQSAAVLLSRDGHRVEVFERAPEPGPVSAGFLLQPTGLQVLWRMGLLDAALAYGAPVRRLYGETPAGRAVMDMRYAGLDARLFGLGMQRGALFELLAQAWGIDAPTNDGFLHRGTRIDAVVSGALSRFEQERRRHVAIYQFWSRWLTPLFQSSQDLVAKARDVAFLPLGRIPGASGHMLRVLGGTQQGLFGRRVLEPEFVAALHRDGG